MHTTVAQNLAHHSDIAWIKTAGRYSEANGVRYLSEYRNCFTGQTIRKGAAMTGKDWFIFDSANRITGQAHSLTWAKLDAAK